MSMHAGGRRPCHHAASSVLPSWRHPGLVRLALLLALVPTLLPAPVLPASGAHAGEDTLGGHYAGRSAAWWVQRLGVENEAEGAAAALVLIGPPALPALLAGLDVDDAQLRRRVLGLFPRIPGGGRAAAPAALDLLANVGASEAAVVLGVLEAAEGFEDPRLMPVLRRAWQRHVPLRARLADLAAAHADGSPDAVTFLRELLVTSEAVPQLAAWRALFRVDAAAPEVVAFAAAVLDGGPPYRTHAIHAALTSRRPLPEVWTAVLLQVAEGGTPQAALDALRLLPADAADGERARAAWKPLLFQGDAQIRMQALQWWAATPERAAEVAADVVPLLRGSRQDIDGALGVLERAGERASPAVPHLLELDLGFRATYGERLHRIIARADPEAQVHLLARLREAPADELTWLPRVPVSHEGLVRDAEAAAAWIDALLERFRAQDSPAWLQSACIWQAQALESLAPGHAARHLERHWDGLDAPRRHLVSGFLRSNPEVLRARHLDIVASGSPLEARDAFLALRADPSGQQAAGLALVQRMAAAEDADADALVEAFVERSYSLDADWFATLGLEQRAPFQASLRRLWRARNLVEQRRWLTDSGVAALLPPSWAPELMGVVDALPPDRDTWLGLRNVLGSWMTRHPGSLESALGARLARGDDRQAARAANLLCSAALFGHTPMAALDDAAVRRLLGLVTSPEADLQDLAWSALVQVRPAPSWLVDALLALEVRPGSEADRSRLFALAHAGSDDPRAVALVLARAGRRDDPLRTYMPMALRGLGEAGRAAFERLVEDPLEPAFDPWIQMLLSGPPPSAALCERLRAFLQRPDFPTHWRGTVHQVLARTP